MKRGVNVRKCDETVENERENGRIEKQERKERR